MTAPPPRQGKWTVPLPKVRAVGEDEVFKVLRTGKRRKKSWKRMVTKVTYVGEDFTRKPPKYERFIRPMVSTPSPLLRSPLTPSTPSPGSEVQEGSRHTPRGQSPPPSPFPCLSQCVSSCAAEGHLLSAADWSQEEPTVPHVHAAGSHHQGNGDRGQREPVVVLFQGCKDKYLVYKRP